MTKMSLRSWLLLCSLLPAVLVSVFCAGYFSYVRYQELALSFSEKAQHIALPLSISSQDLLSRQNTVALEQLLSSAHRLNSPLLSNISLFDANHQALIHTNPQRFNRALQLSSTQKLAPTGLLADNWDGDITIVNDGRFVGLILGDEMVQAMVKGEAEGREGRVRPVAWWWAALIVTLVALALS